METIDDKTFLTTDGDAGPRPGVVIVYSCGRPLCVALPLGAGDAVELGRDELAALGVEDARVSRRHVAVRREEGSWSVRDLGSRNGSYADARPVRLARGLAAPVVRVGHTLLLPVHDVRPYESPGVAVRDGAVLGPATREVHERAALVARGGTAGLLVQGGSGSGKELVAAAFHAAAGPSRPFVAVNCATIQHELAERILFGARRGAYTGAVADAAGLVQAADGGTLFLDEVAELDPAVQAKLLRVLETRKVTPLGAVHPVSVDVRVCAATHKDLRAEVAAGRFREDLYFRVGRPEVRVPPLAERREEVPWLVERALAGGAGPRVTAGVEFVEACMLRQWPGNVRELLAETATAALAAGARRRAALSAADLDDEAGRPLGTAPPTGPASGSGDRLAPAAAPPEPDAVEAALRAEGGNVARAAACLGVSRSWLRRFVERHGLDVRALRAD